MSDSVKIVEQAIYLFVILDDIIKNLGHRTDRRAQCSDSQVMTAAMNRCSLLLNCTN